MKKISRMIAHLYRLEPRIIFLGLCGTLSQVLAPLIILLISRRFLDKLILAKAWSELSFDLLLLIGLSFCLFALGSYLERRFKLWQRFLEDRHDLMEQQKMASLELADLESERFWREHEEHLMETSFREIGARALSDHFWKLARGLWLVLSGFGLALPLFLGGQDPLALKTAWILIICLALALITWRQMRMVQEVDEKVRLSQDKDLIRISEIFGFYTNHYVLQPQGAKDMRIYTQDFVAEAGRQIETGLPIFVRRLYQIYRHLEQKKNFYVMLTQLLIYGYIAYRAYFSGLTAGEILLYAGVLNSFAEGLNESLTGLSRMHANWSYFNYHFRLMERENARRQGLLPVEKRVEKDYSFSVQDLSFRYPNVQEDSLRGLNLELQAGRKYAVVGLNGSGKTTFVKLLCAFYEVRSGRILLNGLDIQKLDSQEYLDLFSIVFQDFKLFALSIAQNVAASADYDADKVRDCLQKVGFSERLETLPQGIETYLYSDFDAEGYQISGGEAQKIALARALYKDAPIVILDEPTAALDPVSEYEIYTRFRELTEDKTTIYISHRLASCRFCDEIIVFDAGRIVQIGTHAELLAQEGGRYAELWWAQADYYQD